MNFLHWFKSKPPDPFFEIVEGMAQMVHGMRALNPEWECIEIVRTENGIKWGVVPEIGQK